MPRTTGELSFNDALRALAHRNRRRLLVALLRADRDEAVSVPEEIGVRDSEVETLRILFGHKHLPLLEELGIVSWDRADFTVSRGPNFGELRTLLALLDEHQQDLPGPWT